MGAIALVLSLWQAAPAADVAVRTVQESGPPERCFDVLFVGDGYLAADLAEGRYGKDVARATEQLFDTAPFSWYRAKTNVRALQLESAEAGCDQDKTDKVKTALDCAFDGGPREYLRFRAHDELLRRVEQTGPVDCVFVIVNSSRRGAGGTLLQPSAGFLPAPTFSGQDPASFGMALHALGHSLGLLNDEFAGSSTFCPDFDDQRLPPGGPNVAATSADGSAMVRDDLPWKHFRQVADGKKHDWMFEGAGRREKDAYRPWKTCRMRESDAPFCPVCTEELAKVLQKLCGLPWDDEEYHRAHPLKLWKK